MPFCTQCGFQNDDDARYCNNCSHELGDSSTSPTAAKNRGKGKWLWLIIGLLLLLAAGATVWHLRNTDIWCSADSAKKKDSNADPDSTIVSSTEKPREIMREISRIQKTASKTADMVFGSDQKLGSIPSQPTPLRKGLTDVEQSRHYHYTPQDCNHLFSDVGQQVAHSIENEIIKTTEIPEEAENRLGRELSKQIEKRYEGKLDIDEDWLAYVRSLGGSLVSKVGRKGIDYHFHVVRSDDVNAFAIPGGGIYIFTGILGKIKNEAQLAHVLTHEIKHVDLRHCIAIYQIIGRLPGVMQNHAAIITKFVKHPYNARVEAEADRRSLEVLYALGYSPYQAVNFWENRMEEKGEIAENRQDRGLLGDVIDTVRDEMVNVLNTHPKYQKRCCLLKNHIIKLQEKYPMDRLYVGKWNFESKVSIFRKKI